VPNSKVPSKRSARSAGSPPASTSAMIASSSLRVCGSGSSAAQALRTLAVTGDTEHVAAVRDRLDDDHEGVRRQAARALERMAQRLDLDDLDDRS